MKDENRQRRDSDCLHPSRPAFTLIEILVVIGVIVILVSMLLPMVMRSYAQAGRIRAQADLQTISIALAAYKDDFGDIPRPGNDQYSRNHGAALLGKALLGPYGDGKLPGGADDNADPPAYQATVAYTVGDVFRGSSYFYVTLVNAKEGTMESDDKVFARFDPRDGADGPGFRKRAGGAGAISPPYLQAGKIAVRGTYLLDHYGNPIVYFPASTTKRDLTHTTSLAKHQPYVDQIDSSGTVEPRPLYNADDNFEIFARRNADGQRVTSETDPLILTRIRIMLGDYNANGYIDATDGPETAVTAPYLLWTAGPDGILGPIGITIPAGSPSPAQVADFRLAVPKCDDIVNFR